jgi:hypothetical protein
MLLKIIVPTYNVGLLPRNESAPAYNVGRPPQL